ncbi:KilA-N domain-containing protein [Plebeiibacterium sediminum]|uniref:KilA-N domain-containing protein n=1 Tax=Plebeiibacterium sediminum TaxID=2992112 RepID=A0AAE3SD79_9BACT|nr:KilA-N domain-containing protein [Plebeiobacterium sediminum]MCW3784933.1 KilA-N domain-containing protein [Plebeiobacterium sediminum]
MNTIKIYGGTEVTFDSFTTMDNLMVNATQMGKAFSKRVHDFLRLDSTQRFIEVLEKKYGNNNSQNGNSRSETSSNVLIISNGGRNNGTWMHRLLALKFAAWIDPEFELWVYETIEEILYTYSREQDESIQRTVLIQHELNEMEEKADKSGEDFEQYIELKNKLVYERTLRANATRRRFRSIYKHLKENEVFPN